MNRSRSKKVVFRLEQDADGYPPATTESVWANEVGEGRYQLDNIPFFTREATLGDVVHARSEDGELVFAGIARRSSNSLIRVVYFDPTDPQDVRDELEKLGCATEWMEDFDLIAVNVPDSVPLADVQKALEAGSTAGRWDYEEAILRG